MRRYLFIFMFMASLTLQGQTVAFWNVENFFDIHNDTLKDDDDFTPYGRNHWNNARYEKKRNDIYKTILALGDEREGAPMLVGLAEVENEYVLRYLCRGTPLRMAHYGWVHFESPDRRGVDVALLYRTDLFALQWAKAIDVSDTAVDFYTRDLLLTKGVTSRGDTIYVAVCHLPSKLGGDWAEKQRVRIAGVLRHTLDTIATLHPHAYVVAMGDFNSDPQALDVTTEGFTNLMSGQGAWTGSYKYREQWSFIDQILVSDNLLPLIRGEAGRLEADFLLELDRRYGGCKPRRTYAGYRYRGGVSDHLPVRFVLNLSE